MLTIHYLLFTLFDTGSFVFSGGKSLFGIFPVIDQDERKHGNEAEKEKAMSLIVILNFCIMLLIDDY